MSSFKLTDLEVKTLCQAGAAAPSGGNVQPWKVEIESRNIVNIFIDKSRSGNFLDIGSYASYLAIGSFFENMKIAANYLGLVFKVVYSKSNNLDKPIIKIETIAIMKSGETNTPATPGAKSEFQKITAITGTNI